MKGGTYVVNHDEHKSLGPHWKDLYVKCNRVANFNSFDAEHIP